MHHLNGMSSMTLETPVTNSSEPSNVSTQASRRIRRVARLMDDAITVPVINRKIGYDGIIGLIPGIGDVVTAIASSYIIAEAARAGVPKRALLKMGARLGIDTLVGMIPIVGDLYDFAYKANRKNAATALKYIEVPHPRLTVNS